MLGHALAPDPQYVAELFSEGPAGCFRGLPDLRAREIVKPEWRSYDSAAAAHDQLAVPTIFERPARELVARIGVTVGSIVLDVGTGTGVAALAAAESAAVVV